MSAFVPYDDTSVTTYNYDKNNRLLEEERYYVDFNDTSITSYKYDKNGNLITKVNSKSIPNSGTGQSLSIKTADELETYEQSEYFTYNIFNQLKSYRNTKGITASYEYLPNNYRYSKTVGSTTTRFLWDGDYIAGELDSTGNISKKYFYGIDMLSDDSGNNYVYDIHGSITDELNSSGTKVNTYDYSAFGKRENTTNSKVSNPWQYCGEYKDSETGLIYLRNRYYDPETGRFINEDPIRNGGNWYSYASQNPIMFIDPFGLLNSATYDYVSMMIMNMNFAWKSSGFMAYPTGGDVVEQPNTLYGESIDQARARTANEVHGYFEDMQAAIADDGTSNGANGIVYSNFIGTAFGGGHNNLCWAYCNVTMYYYYNPNVERNTVEDAEKLAISVNGIDFDQPGHVYGGPTDYNVSFDNITGYLTDGPIFATTNVNKDNGSFAHSIVIVGAYSYKGNKYISYYDPSCGNRTTNYNDMIGKSAELELVGLQKTDKDKINSIGGVLK